uniref:Uncharacterized protein n=1 Tax=Mantoniella antarctica TaxID=81844 RepID=A0A7S0S8U8_9CHLO
MAWRERFHDSYWRQVVGVLSSDPEVWKAAADTAFEMRGKIVAEINRHRRRETARNVVVGFLCCLLIAGVGVAGYKLFLENGGMETNSVISISVRPTTESVLGLGATAITAVRTAQATARSLWDTCCSRSAMVLSSRYQDVLAAVKAASAGRAATTAVKAEGYVVPKDLSQCSTDELKAQLDRLKARRE